MVGRFSAACSKGHCAVHKGEAPECWNCGALASEGVDCISCGEPDPLKDILNETYSVTSRESPEPSEESRGLGRRTAEEIWHRCHGRGLGIVVRREQTGEIIHEES